MDKIPVYVSPVFILTTIATSVFIYFSVHQAQNNKKEKTALIVGLLISVWLVLTALLGHNNFYLDFDAKPPRLVFGIVPPLLTILALFVNSKSRAYLRNIPITTLTYLHTVRVPVEMVLWWLFLGGLVPKLMTFEGINYDILSGVTAPFIAIFAMGFKNKRRLVAIIWNIIALILLINIVGHAILSAPFPFQKFAFDMPNVGVLYFPYVWLPTFIVPAVLFSHLVALMKLFEVKSGLK
ncbi:hypothetical protein [Reichenbachiella sp. MALMAid0571]|uniref:hypothetical protein n=1 Tax=Reichenbachiella sp. MALMAid0571 TaxID=3143939 RepID=UPI0032DFC60D